MGVYMWFEAEEKTVYSSFMFHVVDGVFMAQAQHCAKRSLLFFWVIEQLAIINLFVPNQKIPLKSNRIQYFAFFFFFCSCVHRSVLVRVRWMSFSRSSTKTLLFFLFSFRVKWFILLAEANGEFGLLRVVFFYSSGVRLGKCFFLFTLDRWLLRNSFVRSPYVWKDYFFNQCLLTNSSFSITVDWYINKCGKSGRLELKKLNKHYNNNNAWHKHLNQHNTHKMNEKQT